MTTQWNVTFKPALLNDVAALPAKEAHQVMAKVALLMQDPTPDAKVKKQLKYMHKGAGRLYRVRSGDYRIFYTFAAEKQSISLLAIRRRDDDTYDEDMDAELLEGLDVELDGQPPAQRTQVDWEQRYAQKAETPLPEPLSTQKADRSLPEPITVDLLKRLRVRPEYHTRLLPLTSEDALLNCPGVEDGVLLEIDHYMFERPLIQVMQQPDHVLNDVNDLLRYKEGELLAFLLKLSPEQEKYVHWSLASSGPTLVKGGPGTGKSTVALYRVRSMLEQLLKTGQTPRILFTTYTNALIKSSEQLLQQLLGANAQYVRVLTADKIAREILHASGQVGALIDTGDLHRITRQAVSEVPLEGNLLQQQAQRQTLARMGPSYLLQEFNTVIVARQIDSLEAYLAAPRNGRKLRLNAMQRRVVWHAYERWRDLLLASGKETWQQRRARAEALASQSHLYQAYDAVVIDEAQDLDPSALRMLIALCKAPNRLFVTADANQAIYGSGFTWTDVHQSLRFQGRTSILRANYRSTYEIGEAAQAYLTYGASEPETSERQYVNNGPLPDVRAIISQGHEAQLLESFFKKACRSLRLTA
ncbi:MAG: UvrD-helicase domain-containing protein, partial [Ktedonobacteraceae bacterium]